MRGAAVVPGTPMLAPRVTGAGKGSARACVPLREAAGAAVRSLLDRRPEAVVCLCVGGRTRHHDDDAWGTLAGLGVAVDAPAVHAAAAPTLPLPLTLARMLLDGAGWRGRVVLQEVGALTGPPERRALAEQLLRTVPGAGWLVVGDASAARSPQAPRGHDPRAELFDAAVARALGEADTEALARLDPHEAAVLGVTGLQAWQVLAEATGQAQGTVRPAGELLHAAAPFGVGYVVARWLAVR